MALINFFISKPKKTASLAKKRLKIMIKESNRNHEFFGEKIICLSQIKKDLLKVINKYEKINSKMLSVQIEQKKRNSFLFKIDVTFLNRKE